MLIEKFWGYKKLSTLKKMLIVIGFAIVFGIISWIDVLAAFFAVWAVMIYKHEIFKKLK